MTQPASNLIVAAGELARRRSTISVMGERLEQIFKHGYTAEHDAQHDPMDLAIAAYAYACVSVNLIGAADQPTVAWTQGLALWPFADGFTPSPDPRGNLVKAAALLFATIDRLDATAQDAPLVDGEPR